VHRALVGADPAELRVAGDLAPEPADVLRDLFELLPDDDGRSAFAAATTTSLPRPIVNVRP